MRVAVITIVSGRRRHLERQHAALAVSTTAPELYEVVAMDDPGLGDWHPATPPTPRVQHLAAEGGRLPLASARNAGARAVIDRGAELLVFLDVDCLPAPGLLERYSEAAAQYPDALLAGPVGYLPEGTDYDEPASYAPHFHEFRPRPREGEFAFGSHELFWSLSFAATSAAWHRVGGFHEAYRGYGGEDTDFALTAERAGVPLVWVGGAVAYHQWHETQDPPVQHVDDILSNGAVFRERWGHWPMQGWLDDLERSGIITRDPSGAYSRKDSAA